MAMFNIPKPLKPRGIRFSLPGGFVLGRVSPGMGDAELIPIDQLAQAQLKTGIIAPGPVAGGGSDETTLGFTLTGPYSSLQVFQGAPSLFDTTYPASGLTSACTVTGVAPAFDVRFYLVTDLATFLASGPPDGAIAYVDIAAGATTGTVTFYDAATTVPAGTVPYLVMPELPDPFLTTLVVMFAGKP